MLFLDGVQQLDQALANFASGLRVPTSGAGEGVSVSKFPNKSLSGVRLFKHCERVALLNF